MWMMMDGVPALEHEATVSAFDHGFMYGIGLFETFRVYNGVPFLIDRHLRRLRDSCATLQIQWEDSDERVSEDIERLLALNGLKDAYIRLTVSAGDAPLGLPEQPTYTRPRVLIYMKSLPAYVPFVDRTPKSLQVLELRRNTPETHRRFKSLHYMNNVLGKRECASYPWATRAEGLFLTEAGMLAEGVVSNVFFVRGGVLCTPSLDCGILPGITRDVVLALAKAGGINVSEGFYPLEQLLEAEEVFVTNSIQELVAVDRVFLPDGNHYLYSVGSQTEGVSQQDTNRPPSVTAWLADQYERLRRG